MNLRELYQKKGVAVAAARGLVDKASAEKRNLTTEENTQFELHMADVDAVQLEIDRENKLRVAEGIETDTNKPTAPGGGGTEKISLRASKPYETAFARYLVGGKNGINDEEKRALAADGTGAAGAYAVVPEVFSSQLIKAIDDLVFIRQFATKYPVLSAASLGIIALSSDPADADWTSELLTGDPDTSMTLGKRSLTPYALAKSIYLSQKLIRIAALPIEALVRERLAYKFAITEEKAFLLGSGANQPLGLFEPSANGVPTSRDVEATEEDSLTAEDLIDAKYALKSGYSSSPSCRWIFHRTTLAAIRKLKSIADGQFIWQPGLAIDREDTILSVPVVSSEYCPATLTTGLYYGMIGDLKYYGIADALNMTIQVLDQVAALTNQIVYVCRCELDGCPLLAEAFCRLKMNPGT